MHFSNQVFIQISLTQTDGRARSFVTQYYRKEVSHMPWYINPVLTCKVLNRIANRYPRANLQDLKTTLDNVTQSLWSKQEQYYNSKSPVAIGAGGLNGVGRWQSDAQTIQQEI